MPGSWLSQDFTRIGPLNAGLHRLMEMYRKLMEGDPGAQEGQKKRKSVDDGIQCWAVVG